METKENQTNCKDRILTYQEYRAYLNNKARQLDLNQLLKDTLTKNE